MTQINIHNLNSDRALCDITAEETELIQGAGWAKDTFDWIDETWVEIKNGIADAWEEN